MLCCQFTASVFRIRLWGVTLADFLIGLFLFDSPEDAEAAHEDKAFQWHPCFQQCLCQVLRTLGIDTVEIRFVQTFRHTGSMHHIIEVLTPQLFHELCL